jgi:hypothetical protein
MDDAMRDHALRDEKNFRSFLGDRHFWVRAAIKCPFVLYPMVFNLPDFF